MLSVQKRRDRGAAGQWTLLAPTRCVRPTIGARGRSTYLLVGYAGYIVATVCAAALAAAWNLSLAERLVVLVGPPVAFIVVVALATAFAGRPVAVFYQAALGAASLVAALGLAIDARLPRLLDVTVLGIGILLVFGRVGCFHVACCHGRPARRGVVYGPAHVEVGLWPRWAGRPLLPIQLLESAGALALVVAGLVASRTPGSAALLVATGYAVLRFALELWRGDPERPYALGLSEAQWCSLAVATIGALARPSAWTLAALAIVLAATAWLVLRRRRRELFLPPHLRDVERVCAMVLADASPARRETSLGVRLSCHPLPEGRLDWILSSEHPAWSTAAAQRLARDVWLEPDVIAGRTPAIVHVIVTGEVRPRA